MLQQGLEDRWCDRYENRGKQSGAFSAGSYDGKPYILINFQPDVLDSVFTLAHEGGHSMHSYFTAKTQPYAYYQYVIFVAEVASTFNETLLSRLSLEERPRQERAGLSAELGDRLDPGHDLPQAMFAEFEKLAHASAEAGEPLTLDRFKEIHHGLLKLYFGPGFTLDPEMDLECLRVSALLPGILRLQVRDRHVGGDCPGQPRPRWRAARVGRLSAASSRAVARKIRLDLLRGAGVDMEKPHRVDSAV